LYDMVVKKFTFAISSPDEFLSFYPKKEHFSHCGRELWPMKMS